MASDGTSSKRSARGPVLVILFALLLIAVVIGIVKLIQAAPSVGEVANGEMSGDAPQGPPPASVFVETVNLESAQNTTTVTGTIRATSRAEIAAREPESVEEVLVDKGDHVAVGDKLVRLSGDRIEAEIVELQAQIRSAEKMVNQQNAELERAKTDLEMKKGLLVDKAISRSDFLDSQSASAVKKAQAEAAMEAVNQAQSRMDLLKIRQKDLEIRAPFSGIITERHVEPGEWVGAGDPVMTLVTIDPVEAWMNVPERFLRDVNDKPGDIRVQLSSSSEVYVPKEVKIVPDVDRRSQLFTVVAKLDNPDGSLAPGQSIAGAVPVGKNESHFVFPVDALLRSRLGDFVFVVDSSGEVPMPTARKISVHVEFERGEYIFVRAIDAKLKKGDRVIIEGNDRLQPGQSLVIREEGDGAPVVKP